MKKILIIALLSLTSFCCLSFSEEAEFRIYNGMMIKAVNIQGGTSSTKDISTQLLTGSGKKFNAAFAVSDLDKLYSTGRYADVRLEFIKDPLSQLTVKFILIENPTVKKIIIEGCTVYSAEEIKKQMNTSTGQPLNLNTLRQDVALIEKNLYDEKGYILTRIATIDKPSSENDYVLFINIEEGLIDTVELEGNDQTRDYVILREMILKPGDVFNKDALLADLRRIFNMNYFSAVEPRYIPSPKDPNKIVLIIKVEEKSTNTINFGGGWGAVQGGFAFIDLQMGNMFGTGQLLSAKAQMGDTSTYQLKYYNPWMWEDRTSLTSRYWLTTGRPIGIEGVESTGTSERRYGFDLTVGKVLQNNIVGKVTLLNEDVAPSNNESYNIRSIGLSLAYDTRDIWMDPSCGVYYVIGLEEAGRFLSGTVSYTRWRGELNHFTKVAEGQTIAQRLSWARQSGEVKSTEEFWMGGPNTVRGFPSGKYFSRGREKLLYNVEYRYRFNEAIQGVLFYDIGNAWDTIADFVNSREYRSSYGFGVRVSTPMGPIRLDYGVPDDSELGRGVIHFSIGHVF
ncbi:MAG: BamA/TamA family outer membrane protein [Candidatus Margulisiibacteriota bacterium]